MSGRKFTYLLTYLSKNCTANINGKEENSEENEGVQSDDEEINLVDL